MMPFIEDVTCRAGVTVEATPRRLNHDQCVVSDHKIGTPRAAHAPLDIAFLIMWARGVDAFPMVITKIKGQSSANEIDQPGWKVTAR